MELKNTVNMSKERRDRVRAYSFRIGQRECQQSLFNNCMFRVLGFIQLIEEKDKVKIENILFLLGLLEAHYFRSNRPKWLRNAFKYLKLFFEKYPNVTLRNSCAAYVMVKRIYAAAAMSLDFSSGFSPRYSKRELSRRENRQNVHQAQQPVMACAA